MKEKLCKQWRCYKDLRSVINCNVFRKAFGHLFDDNKCIHIISVYEIRIEEKYVKIRIGNTLFGNEKSKWYEKLFPPRNSLAHFIFTCARKVPGTWYGISDMFYFCSWLYKVQVLFKHFNRFLGDVSFNMNALLSNTDEVTRETLV